MEAIRPRYVIVSTGEGNEYCHPKEEVLERVAEIGASLLGKDELGIIEVIMDGL